MIQCGRQSQVRELMEHNSLVRYCAAEGLRDRIGLTLTCKRRKATVIIANDQHNTQNIPNSFALMKLRQWTEFF